MCTRKLEFLVAATPMVQTNTQQLVKHASMGFTEAHHNHHTNLICGGICLGFKKEKTCRSRSKIKLDSSSSQNYSSHIKFVALLQQINF